MTLAVAITNIILGSAYTSYGVLTAVEMKRGWRTMGFSHFGAAWIAMAFTCGPHHLAHGIHALEGRPGGGLDLYAVMIGLPVGVTWMYLRIEAMMGGRGDRTIDGSPMWLKAMPTILAVYMTTIVFGLLFVGVGVGRFPTSMVANMALLTIYMTIGYFVLRTQLRNFTMTGSWSVSGLCLTLIFPTCGVMHAIFAFYGMTGLYYHDAHTFLIDWFAVPAGLYFLWVVRSLYKGTLQDWNRRSAAVPAS